MGICTPQFLPVAPCAPPHAICVLGMHRSGTSALAGVLNLLGVDLGRDLMPAGSDNPKGFWEHGRVVALHLGLLKTVGSWTFDPFPLPAGWERQPEMDWYRDSLLNTLQHEFAGKRIWAVKDPRACRLLAIWKTIFDMMQVRPLYVLMMRDPFEIAKSLRWRNDLNYNQGLLLTLGHLLEAEHATRGHRRVVVTYGQLMTDWPATVAKIQPGLGLPWPRDPAEISSQVTRFLDPALQHARTHIALTPAQAACITGVDSRLSRWTYAAYHALANDVNRIDCAALDQIRGEFASARRELLPWRPPPPADQKFTTEYKDAPAMLSRHE